MSMRTVSRRGLAAAACIILAMLFMLPLGAFAADGAIVINSRYGDEPVPMKWSVYSIGSRSEDGGFVLNDTFAQSGADFGDLSAEAVADAADRISQFIFDSQLEPDFQVTADDEGIARAEVGQSGLYFITSDAQTIGQKQYTSVPSIVEVKDGDAEVMAKLEAEDIPEDSSSSQSSSDSVSESTPDTSSKIDSSTTDTSSGKDTGDGFADGGGKKDQSIPQTGQLWWPVPVMALVGLILVAMGIRVYTKKDNSND